MEEDGPAAGSVTLVGDLFKDFPFGAFAGATFHGPGNAVLRHVGALGFVQHQP